MCGIAGIFQRNSKESNTLQKELEIMLQAIAHRGPDSQGTFTQSPIALGVNRLAIMDPVPRSDQPMTSPCGRFTIAFNGEIYNFRSLREQLIRQGESFATQSDTEVVLLLYKRTGAQCLSLLRGMYAFAIWDQKTRKLFIARDRMGEKPLYYFEDSHKFIFASEIPALLSCPEVPRRIDPVGINLAMSFMHPIAPKTAFKDIKKLPPAHYIEISYDRAELTQYWSCTFDPSSRLSDEQECIEEIRNCFDQTVSLMCRSDTPVGALLSGGIDSSAVVASMSRALKDFPTFRISAQEETPANVQETLSARQIADRYQTRHFEFNIRSDNFSVMKEVIRHHGEPIATPVPMDAYLLSLEIGKSVKVAFCGAGGDELFGGYNDHALMHLWDHYLGKWTNAKGALALPEKGLTKDEKFALEIIGKRAGCHPERAFPALRYNHLDIQKKIYTDAMLEICQENTPSDICASAYLDSGADNLFDGLFAQHLNCVSQYSFSEINDRMGMAHGVEIRSPFLDVNMVELAARIPARLKIGDNLHQPISKNIFKKAMADRLPDTTLKCTKIGFGGTVPYAQWIQEDSAQFIESKLFSDTLADSGLFDPAGIQQMYTLYRCGVPMDRDLFIGLISIAIWLETYF